MIVQYFGRLLKLSGTKIRDVGTYKNRSEIGDTQSLIFLNIDEGSFYLSPKDYICGKFDQPNKKYIYWKQTSCCLLISQI